MGLKTPGLDDFCTPLQQVEKKKKQPSFGFGFLVGGRERSGQLQVKVCRGEKQSDIWKY